MIAYSDREFLCPGMSSKDVNSCLDFVYARSLPFMFVCPLILFIVVVRPSCILNWSEVTMAVMSGL